MSELARHVVVLTTVPAEGDTAEILPHTLVARRLAACVNVLPAMTSVYLWGGKIERGEERQLIIKTTAEQLPKIEEAFRELHPYDIPELIALEIVGGSQRYLEWVTASVSR